MTKLTTKEAAELRGVHISTIKLWAKSGLKFEKNGRDLFFNKSDVQKYKPNKPGNPHKPRKTKG